LAHQGAQKINGKVPNVGKAIRGKVLDKLISKAYRATKDDWEDSPPLDPEAGKISENPVLNDVRKFFGSPNEKPSK
jgi:hypothetical protein